MNIKQKVYFVISACRNINPREDAVATDELNDILAARGDNYAKTTGRYEGREEECFLVEAPSHFHGEYSSRALSLAAMLELAQAFDQYYIAEIDAQNELLYFHSVADGSEKYIGRLRQVDEEPAGDYTKVGDSYLTLYDS